MDLGINDKLALVTGASKGLGRAIAIQLAGEGARLVLVARSADRLKTLAGELSAPNRKHHCFAYDLLQEGACAALVKDMIAEAGHPDIIVHCLGGSLNVKEALAPVADWQKVWFLNVGVGIELNGRLIPHMVQKGWGRVVHISSAAAHTYLGYPAYVSAKLALNGYVKAVSRAVAAQNVVVSAVSPGPLFGEGRYLAQQQTANSPAWQEFCRNRLALGRLGEGGEIAPAVVFLCSTLSSFAVGSIFNVDGGSM